MGGGTKEAEEGSTKDRKKTCYYEVLSVEKTATDKEINKAYKKASLKWHPDKNRDEDTTDKFQEVNEAYQTLSDAQSRAWYDQHKDQILKGKDQNNMAEEDEDYITKAKLKPFFKDSCHGGFDTSKDNNFWKVYGQLFRQLDTEEELEETVNSKHFIPPTFGTPTSSAFEVFAFYEHWQFFSSKKQFAYADVYNPNDAPNRQVKRLIEQENKRERNQERIRFNNCVRELVQLLQDKDPRYKRFDRERRQEKEAKRAKLEGERLAKKEAQSQLLKEYREERAKQIAKAEEEAIERGEVEEVLIEEYVCEICKKSFKKEGQMDNHLKSKKHKEAAAKFREKYQLDDDTEELMKRQNEEIKQSEEEKEEEKRREEEKAKAAFDREDEDNSKKKRKNKVEPQSNSAQAEVNLDDIDEWLNEGKKGKKKEKKVKKGSAAQGHNKILDDLNKKFYESRDKIKKAQIAAQIAKETQK